MQIESDALDSASYIIACINLSRFSRFPFSRILNNENQHPLACYVYKLVVTFIHGGIGVGIACTSRTSSIIEYTSRMRCSLENVVVL